MPPPPRRARFQIHLSTAIVLMFVAGGLIWANVNGRRILIGGPFIGTEQNYGWPCLITEPFTRYITERRDGTWDESLPDISYSGVAVDLAVSVAILFAVWFTCEWLIRRRAARKGA